MRKHRYHPSTPVLPVILARIDKLIPRDAAILLRRLGISGPVRTLQELADGYSLTRERIRQIVKKSIATSSADDGWAANLGTYLETRLDESFIHLEDMASSPWSAGLSQASMEAIAVSVTEANILDLPSIGRVLTYLHLNEWTAILQDFETSVAKLSIDEDAWKVIDGPIARSGCCEKGRRDARKFLETMVDGLNFLSLKNHYAGIGNALEALVACHDQGISVEEAKRLLEAATHQDMKRVTISAFMYDQAVPIAPGLFVSAAIPSSIQPSRWQTLVDACLERLASNSKAMTADELSRKLKPGFPELTTVNVERILLRSPLTSKGDGRRWSIRDGLLGPEGSDMFEGKHAPWNESTWAFALERWAAGDKAVDIAKALGPGFNKNRVTSKLFRAGLMRKPRTSPIPAESLSIRHGSGHHAQAA